MKNKGTRIGLILTGIILTIIAGVLLALWLRDGDGLHLFSSVTDDAEDPESDDGETVFSEISVTILVVGQGSAALIESAGEYALIDTGSTDRAQVPIAVLKRIGAERITLLVNTHWDNDHCGATIGILKNFQVEHFAGAGYETETRTYQRIREYLAEEKIELEISKPGDTYTVGSCCITIVGPVRTDYEGENNRCISLILSDGKSRVFFGGDTEVEGESDLLASGVDLDCDVYICNHHGSADASSRPFLEALSPEYTVISCGRDNEYGHPAKRTLDTIRDCGSLLYRTDLQGDIVFRMTEKGLVFEQDPTEDWTPGVYMQ